MTTLLRIDSSSRLTGSHSSDIADAVQSAWQTAVPNGQIISRRVSDGSIPIIAQDTIEGFYADPADMDDRLRAATRLSDQLIGELQAADTVLITAPIYNFSVPAALKAWIDQIVRIGQTFAVTDGAFQGLVKTRRAIVICAYGAEGYLEGQPFAAANFVQPYLSFLLGFLGIEDITFVAVQATTADPDTVAKNVKQAKQAAIQAIS